MAALPHPWRISGPKWISESSNDSNQRFKPKGPKKNIAMIGNSLMIIWLVSSKETHVRLPSLETVQKDHDWWELDSLGLIQCRAWLQTSQRHAPGRRLISAHFWKRWSNFRMGVSYCRLYNWYNLYYIYIDIYIYVTHWYITYIYSYIYIIMYIYNYIPLDTCIWDNIGEALLGTSSSGLLRGLSVRIPSTNVLTWGLLTEHLRQTWVLKPH